MINEISGEKQLQKIRPLWMSYFGNFFLGAVLFLFILAHWSFFFIALAVIIWAILDRSNTIYTITNKRVVVQRGVFTKQRSDIDIKDIRTISTRQSISQGFIMCGDILIGTAGISGYEIIINNVAEYQKVADIIRAQKQ